jgi:hypothetical protein
MKLSITTLFAIMLNVAFNILLLSCWMALCCVLLWCVSWLSQKCTLLLISFHSIFLEKNERKKSTNFLLFLIFLSCFSSSFPCPWDAKARLVQVRECSKNLSLFMIFRLKLDSFVCLDNYLIELCIFYFFKASLYRLRPIL